MAELHHIRPSTTIGPMGEALTIASLPDPKTTRWVTRRKAEVVAAVNGGLLSFEEVSKRYNLTLEEFVSWQRAIDRAGIPGLRATQVQRYRRAGELEAVH